MLRARASLRIHERVLGIEVVKTALWNYFNNGQGLITEDTYRQFAARYKFFHQQFAIVLAGFFHRRIELAFVFYNYDSDGRSLTGWFDHQRDGNLWSLSNFNHFPLRSDYIVLAKLFLRQKFIECGPAFFDAFASVGDATRLQNF